MKKLSLVLVAVSLALGVSACGKGGDGGGASCDAVVAKMSDMMGKQMTGAIPPDKKALADKMQAKIKEVMLVSCKEDKWPEEVKKCVMDAKDEKAMDECGDKGGKEFEDKVLGMTPDEVASYWIDRKIRGQSGAPKAVGSPELVQKVVSKVDHSIAYVRLDLVRPEVRVIAIDGRLPTDAAYQLLIGNAGVHLALA